MESTTKSEDDANSDITDDLDRKKGKVSYGFTFHVEQPETRSFNVKVSAGVRA